MAAGDKVTQALRAVPGVLSVAQQAGRAELGEDTWGVEYSELEVDLKQLGAEDAGQTEKQIRRALADVPGYSFEVMPFLSERIKETISGTTGAVVVKVFGDDLEAIDRAALDVAAVMARVPGNDALQVVPQTGTPELVVRVRRADAARFGLRNAYLLEAVHNAYQGAEIGQVYDRNRIIDLTVILDPAIRNQPDRVANLWLSVPPATTASAPTEPATAAGGVTNGRIQLKQVADVYLSDGRFMVTHEGGVRCRYVKCNVKKGTDVESFAAAVERQLRRLPLAEGVYYVLSGEHEARRTAQRELLLLSVAAGAGILLFLWMAFGSVRRLVLVLVNLPFALLGGVAAVYLSGGVLNVGSLVGFVTLFGITTRNGIMMVSHWQHLHEVEGIPWGPELVFRGARERLAPVLMTALVTALGLLPIALGSGEAGREIEGPMALVILGGLVTSTALNLLVLPVLYCRFGDPGAALTT
jgi:Cu/Ag efflux pump CusA